MRFMFSFIANITYSIFCLCIEFIILYIYRIFLNSTPDMLSVSVVTMLLFFCVFTYVVCIVLMLVFGIEKFSSESDQMLDMANKSQTQSTVGTEQSGDSENSKTDAPYRDRWGDQLSHISLHTVCALNILICHITVLTSLSTVLFITLYECIQDPESMQCILTWGNHAASQGIAIAIALIMVSILVPMLAIYKNNSSGTFLFDRYIGTYLTFYVFFVHVILETKLVHYQTQCLSSKFVIGGVRWFYGGLCVHLLYHYVVVTVMNVYAPQSTVVVYTEVLSAEFEKWSVFMRTLTLLCNSTVLIFFIAYGYHMSTPFNYIQTILLSIYILSSSYRIVFVREKLAVKKHTS